jgi:hypothetical protein
VPACLLACPPINWAAGVVSPVTAGEQDWAELQGLAQRMAEAVLPLEAVQPALRQPYRQLLTDAGGNTAVAHSEALKIAASWLPDVAYADVSEADRRAAAQNGERGCRQWGHTW